jgi:hypothetical protein
VSRYLVVAEYAASSAELLARVQELTTDDAGAEFAVLVPAAHSKDVAGARGDGPPLTWDENEARTAAEARATEIRDLLVGASADVSRTVVGDGAPLLAVEDELRERPEEYDAILLSTPPPNRWRWRRMGVHERADRMFDLPVLHVFEGGDEAWRDSSGRMRAYVARGSSEPPEDSRGREWPPIRAWHIAALMALYLVGTTSLALTVDRGFFLNDAFAIVIFAVILVWLAVEERTPAR